jgi:hypothetical protein
VSPSVPAHARPKIQRGRRPPHLWALIVVTNLAAGNCRADPPAGSEAPAADSKSQMDTIVVRSQRLRERERLDHVVIPQFVKSHAAAGARLNQIARWQDPLCVRTAGLDAEYNAMVSQRVAEIATDIGARATVDGTCRPNVDILFESSPQLALDRIVRTNDALLGSHYRAELKRLGSFTRLIQAWYVTASVDRDGYATVDSSDAPVLNSSDQGLSLLSSGFTSKFSHALVIIDAVKMGDSSLKPIADYAAFLALTKIDPSDACSELPSILDLLSTTCGERPKPKEITAADTAFLKALYTTDLRLLINMQRGEIHDRMLQGVAPP